MYDFILSLTVSEYVMNKSPTLFILFDSCDIVFIVLLVFKLFSELQ